MKARAATLALAVATLAGCHTYVPATMESVSPGQTVRARLTPEARAELADVTTGDGRALEGELVERNPEELTLAVATAVRREGFFAEGLHERVRLRTSEVMELERRDLDRTRTWVALGAGAAVVAGVVAKVVSGKAGGGTIETEPGPSALLVPLLTLRFR